MLQISALVIIGGLAVVYGCTPFTEHDQTKYCRAQYVFTGMVRNFKEDRIENTFTIQVTSNIKGRISYSGRYVTVYGRGSLNSCGPTRLQRNKEYLLYVSVYDRKPEINEYRDATFTNVNRINNYDCSCQVEMNLPWQPVPESTTNPRDNCVVTQKEFDCTFQRAYCARRHSLYNPGSCQWIAPKTVCPNSRT
ncbi:uncharacterized protein LOC111102394 [Crassostrea virginica]